ncbi:MAG: antA/AntB antirepressor family protein [Bartonella sp.]|nr:antA/AntB antirepressor family protein [Bartonella sp.]MDD9334356.1 antA/AntB antirepressor family protein [Bartonella sp.]
MNTLIEIKEQVIDQETVQTVNARELHAFLEVKRDFSNWIKDRINKYDFKEERDYILTLAKIGERQNVVLKEYYLTLSVAKELSMVENNKKGREARLYFIECEKRVKQVAVSQIDYSSPKAMIGFLTYLQGQIDQKDTLIEDLKPKAAALESLQRHDGLFGLTEAAKILEMQPKQFIQFLQKKGWVYRRTLGTYLLPYQDKIKRGLMDCPTIIIQKSDGTEKVIPSAKVTTKGMGVLSQELQRQSIH